MFEAGPKILGGAGSVLLLGVNHPSNFCSMSFAMLESGGDIRDFIVMGGYVGWVENEMMR